MQPAAPIGLQVLGQLHQQRFGLGIGTLHQMLLRRVTPPAIGVGQVGHQGSRRVPAHLRAGIARHRRGGAIGAHMHHPIDTAMADAARQPAFGDVITKIIRLQRAILGDAAIHVGDIETAIRAASQCRGPKAHIS